MPQESQSSIPLECDDFEITIPGEAPTGSCGDPCSDGKDGSDGRNGIDGINGSDGIDGANGTNGSDGSCGDPCSDGRNGVDGADGTNGADGKDATTLWANCTIDAGVVTLQCHEHIPYVIDLGVGLFRFVFDIDFGNKERFTWSAAIANNDYFYETARTAQSVTLKTASGTDPSTRFGIDVHGCQECCTTSSESEGSASLSSGEGDIPPGKCCEVGDTVCVSIPEVYGIQFNLHWDGSLVWTPPGSSDSATGYYRGWKRVLGCTNAPSGNDWILGFSLGCDPESGVWFYNFVWVLVGSSDPLPPEDAIPDPALSVASSQCDPTFLITTSGEYGLDCFGAGGNVTASITEGSCIEDDDCGCQCDPLPALVYLRSTNSSLYGYVDQCVEMVRSGSSCDDYIWTGQVQKSQCGGSGSFPAELRCYGGLYQIRFNNGNWVTMNVVTCSPLTLRANSSDLQWSDCSTYFQWEITLVNCEGSSSVSESSESLSSESLSSGSIGGGRDSCADAEAGDALSLGQTYGPITLTYPGDDDRWFKFNITSGQTYNIYVTRSSDPAGLTVECFSNCLGSVAGCTLILTEADANGCCSFVASYTGSLLVKVFMGSTTPNLTFTIKVATGAC